MERGKPESVRKSWRKRETKEIDIYPPPVLLCLYRKLGTDPSKVVHVEKFTGPQKFTFVSFFLVCAYNRLYSLLMLRERNLGATKRESETIKREQKDMEERKGEKTSTVLALALKLKMACATREYTVSTCVGEYENARVLHIQSPAKTRRVDYTEC